MIWYCTREDVKSALDSKESARNNAQIDRAIESASRAVEGYLKRRFYPLTTTRYFDWPNFQFARPWRLWLDDNELVSVTTLTSGGQTISPSDYFLEPVNSGPPYTHIEIDLESTAAFSSGSTHQRSIAITGVFGYWNEEEATETLLEDLDASETAVDFHDSVNIGVGSILRVGTERMIVTGRSTLTAGGGIADDLTASQANVRFEVASSLHFHAGETILVDGERMLVVDFANDFLTVRRAWDGTVLASHSSGATIYRYNAFTVQRGALGTTATTHTNGAQVYRYMVPGLVRELAVAEAINTLLQQSSGYARVVGSGDNQRESFGRGLRDIREAAYIAYGRKTRMRAV